jgi:hypothetical protein
MVLRFGFRENMTMIQIHYIGIAIKKIYLILIKADNAKVICLQQQPHSSLLHKYYLSCLKL